MKDQVQAGELRVYIRFSPVHVVRREVAPVRGRCGFRFFALSRDSVHRQKGEVFSLSPLVKCLMELSLGISLGLSLKCIALFERERISAF